jgi:hypothetical protein
MLATDWGVKVCMMRAACLPAAYCEGEKRKDRILLHNHNSA